MNSTQKPSVPGMVERTCFDKSAALRKKVHDTIPGGAHTYAKGDDQYPERSPGFIERGKGCHIWDVDGNEFIEYGMGLRAVTLGHAYPSVIEAAYRQMQLGNNFNRPAPIELECAQMLQSLVPSAEMVKFAKDGSTVLTAALKLARAYTGRDLVAICSNSPFFSYNDWFIGTTAMDGGVSRVEVELTVKFNYNDIDSLQKLFEQYPNRIAMVLLEPARTEEPTDGFLQKVIDLAHRNGALVTLDETISGFRFHQGGAQTLYGVTPDMSCFGKALANGFSLSALTGKREVMELGGLYHDKARVFLLSTTTGLYFLDITDEFVNKYGILGGALACIIATVWFVRKLPVLRDHLNRFSSFKVGRGWMALVGVASPLVLGYMLINDFIGKLGKPYENYPQHLLVIFGWGMSAALVIIAVVLTLLPWRRSIRTDFDEQNNEHEVSEEVSA